MGSPRWIKPVLFTHRITVRKVTRCPAPAQFVTDMARGPPAGTASVLKIGSTLAALARVGRSSCALAWLSSPGLGNHVAVYAIWDVHRHQMNRPEYENGPGGSDAPVHCLPEADRLDGRVERLVLIEILIS